MHHHWTRQERRSARILLGWLTLVIPTYWLLVGIVKVMLWSFLATCWLLVQPLRGARWLARKIVSQRE